MTSTFSVAKKIIRGKQRQAVHEALRVPRTGKQILELAREQAPRMTYQDLRHILRSFQDQGVAVCLNPENQTGRLYVLASERDQHALSLPEIELQAKLRRAKARMSVLAEIGRDHTFEPKPLTASQIRKNLVPTHPLGLNHVLAAIKYLEQHLLVEVVDYTAKRNLKIFDLTALGRDVLAKAQADKQDKFL
ncbi:hypothetical protein [Cerasicoccus maritimus]|uniref:hypothetical protein n=1 Tax=Cerasicoccus maritimus TaxID=490089 RepID=UPI002852C3F4|nr:hypothetical protein [Cerasicoccus maritimus]